MRGIVSGLAAIVLALTAAAPVVARAEVTNFQVRVHGAEAWLGTGDPWSGYRPPGVYYSGYVQAFVARDSRPGRSLDWVYFGYSTWEKKANGDWELLSDVSGYAPDGAAGLDMQVGRLGWATVHASVPVGWCRSYETEDSGGGCSDYVDVGTVHLDLVWVPTTKLLSWNQRDHQAVPAYAVWNARRTSHYREATLSGQVTLPGWGRLDVESPDGYLTRWGAGEHTLMVKPTGAP